MPLILRQEQLLRDLHNCYWFLVGESGAMGVITQLVGVG